MPHHKIICGKSEIELKRVEDNSFDSCVCDPPYNLTSITRPRPDQTKDGGYGKEVPFSRVQSRMSGGFMGKEWDGTGISFKVELWEEVYRVLKPGAHILVFGGTRTYHRMACAVEDAGFEIRDMVEWVYGSGFPKSLDISKSIDKSSPRMGMFKEFAEHFRNQREKKGLTHKDISKHFPSKTGGLTGCVWNWENGMNVPTLEQWKILQPLLVLSDKCLPLIERIEAERELIGKDGRKANYSMFGVGVTEEWNVTTPASSEAIQWNGWGTSLKPAHEPILLARKTITERNIAANVLKWGVGGINIDKCRISFQGEKDVGDVNRFTGLLPYPVDKGWNSNSLVTRGYDISKGRFPSNLLLECACEEGVLKPDIITRERAEAAVPLHDCSGREYTKDEREDIIRYVIWGAEIQRDKDFYKKEFLEDEKAHANPNCVCRILDEQSGVSLSSGGRIEKTTGYGNLGGGKDVIIKGQPGYLDIGGASRFFYQAKASQAERWFYCTICKEVYQMKQRDNHIHNAPEKTKYKYLVFHPTVKPEKLIGYLVRLVTPPNGTVLDPFMGTGTGLIAAEHEGFNSVNIDSNRDYCQISYRRFLKETEQRKLESATIEKTGF